LTDPCRRCATTIPHADRVTSSFAWLTGRPAIIPVPTVCVVIIWVADWPACYHPAPTVCRGWLRWFDGLTGALLQFHHSTGRSPPSAAAAATARPPGQILRSQRRARLVGVRVERRNGADATRKRLRHVALRGCDGGRAAVKPPIFTVKPPRRHGRRRPPGQILHSQRRARLVGVRVERRCGQIATRKRLRNGGVRRRAGDGGRATAGGRFHRENGRFHGETAPPRPVAAPTY
jgi:hypothetical protein